MHKMTIHEAQQRLIFQLYEVYDNREAGNIADLVMQHITGWKKIDRILNKHLPLLPDHLALLEKYAAELLTHKPVQYVLNEAWFYGIRLFVDPRVLIPRPETEELVEWIIEDLDLRKFGSPTGATISILDIGAGSGCISVALKQNIPTADMFACDVSKEALMVAQKNATENGADIAFLHIDFLDPQHWEYLPLVDVIVSNPPYVPVSDKKAMLPNVVEHEPHLALFVEDDDPLIFYRSIAAFAKERLNSNGAIFVELHEGLAKHAQDLFQANGYTQVEMRKDLQGKARMLKVMR